MDSVIVAKLTAISTAFLLAGYGINASQNSVPILVDRPTSISTPIFANVYRRGIAPVIGGCALSAGAFFYLAYTIADGRAMYATAIGLVVSPLVLTRAIMSPGINRLLETSKKSTTKLDADKVDHNAQRLMQAWIFQNWIRVGLYLGAGFTGLYGTLTGP